MIAFIGILRLGLIDIEAHVHDGEAMKNKSRPFILFLASLWGLGLGSAANANDIFPARPIRIIVPFAPGGSNDVVMRLIAPALSQQLGQSVLIENKPGGGATIGMNLVAKANPDGYTLGVTNTAFGANPYVMSKMPFDSKRDFSSVTLVGKVPLVVVVHPKFSVRSIQELIAYAKEKPLTINYGSAGNASTPHLAGELFGHVTGTKMMHIPFKSGGESIAALLGGVTQLQFAAVPSAVQQVQTGRLIPLAVTTIKRDPSLPDVPTLAEAGLAGLEIADWIGIVAPAGTPAPVIQQLNQAFVQVLKTPQIRESLSKAGAQVIAGTPQELTEHTNQEFERWQALVKSANIKLD